MEDTYLLTARVQRFGSEVYVRCVFLLQVGLSACQLPRVPDKDMAWAEIYGEKRSF